MSAAIAPEALDWFGAMDEAPPGPPESVVARVAAEHGLTPSEIIGPGRRAPLVAARAEVALLLRADGLTLREIGQALGGRHHTTVLHLLEKANIAGYVAPSVRLCIGCGTALVGRQRVWCSKPCRNRHRGGPGHASHRREKRAAQRAARPAA